MRRITWMLAIVMGVSVFLVGCGKKDSDAVVNDLKHVISKLDSYEGEGTMKFHTGQQPQEYHVEVWYQNPHYYRIALTNAKKDITQIVLRNDDGVFVLTPHLKKSFRFQSDWPENQGQVYLYQTLVQSILTDNARQFVFDNKKDSYVFNVAANYHNSSLSRQKIWLNKKDYAPRQVEITDNEEHVMVEVNFESFKFGKTFDKDSFDMDRNMTSWDLKSMPTVATDDQTSDVMDILSGETLVDQLDQPQADADNPSDKADAQQEDFGIVEPTYLPNGVEQGEPEELKLQDKKAIMLRYTGDYNYTLLERRPDDREVSLLPAEVVDLGYAFGALSGDDKKTLTWSYNGIEYRLSSGDLPESEMVNIALSVQGQMGK